MKNKFIGLLCGCIGMSMVSVAQFKIPEGYEITNGVNDSALSARPDLNKDGKKDFIAVIDKEGNAKLIAYISKGSKGYRMLTHPALDFFGCCSSMNIKNGIVSITTTGMRYFETYSFRYSKKLMTLALIGFDSESFGNAIHDGAGTQSVNMLTGDYEFSTYSAIDENNGNTRKGSKKLKLPAKFTLTNFDQAVDFLQELAATNDN